MTEGERREPRLEYKIPSCESGSITVSKTAEKGADSQSDANRRSTSGVSAPENSAGERREPAKRMMVSYPGLPSDEPHEESPDCRAAGCIPLETLKPSAGASETRSAREPQPTLEEWMSQMYEGANLDKLEIPARVCIQIAKSYAASRVVQLEKQIEELKARIKELLPNGE